MSIVSAPTPIAPLAPSGAQSSPTCPLCEQSHLIVASSVTPAQLLAAWATMGVRLSSAALGDLSKLPRINLWRCSDCSFEFSHLEHAGGSQFYEELQTQLPNYYPKNSPEYKRAIDFALAHQLTNILDVGCGSGAFLDLAKQSGLRTHGVELNPKAAAIARAHGHAIFNELLQTLISRGDHPHFSLVTTWQVLEHVSDPVSFLRECAAFVKPGGFLAVAVPAENSINSLSPFNPHFWPPHQVTRWRLTHLRQLGAKIGLKFFSGGNDPLDPYHARYMWELHNSLAPNFAYSPYPGGKLFPKLIAAIAARTRLHKLLPDWGHSTYAFFSKPLSTAS